MNRQEKTVSFVPEDLWLTDSAYYTRQTKAFSHIPQSSYFSIANMMISEIKLCEAFGTVSLLFILLRNTRPWLLVRLVSNLRMGCAGLNISDLYAPAWLVTLKVASLLIVERAVPRIESTTTTALCGGLQRPRSIIWALYNFTPYGIWRVKATQYNCEIG